MSAANDLTASVAKRIRDGLLADRELWGEFSSASELRTYLLRQLDDDDELRAYLERWAKRQIEKERLIAELRVDALWARIRR